MAFLNRCEYSAAYRRDSAPASRFKTSPTISMVESSQSRGPISSMILPSEPDQIFSCGQVASESLYQSDRKPAFSRWRLSPGGPFNLTQFHSFTRKKGGRGVGQV